jgi:iron complex transport system ATP-binding protein
MTLVIDNLSVTFGARQALKPLSLELKAGLIGLIGANGAGKSSCLRALTGLIAHNGRISLEGRDIDELSRRERARLMSYLPQNAAIHWPLRAREIVALGRLPHRRGWSSLSAGDHAVIARVMRSVDVDVLAERPVNQLSQGERARVLIARALAVDAPVLLADEPIAALDPFHQLHIMEVLRDEADRGRLVIAVMHDLALAARFCHELMILHAGDLLAYGTTPSVLSDVNLAKAFSVQVLRGEKEGIFYLLPWQRLTEQPPPKGFNSSLSV